MGTINDPRDHGEKPPFAKQSQESPGTTYAMDPQPDHGEQTYEGHGRLKGRVALITGGDSGIGRAVAIAYAREGADVAISYYDDMELEDAEQTRRWIEEAGRRASIHQVDLSTTEGCTRLVAEVAEEFERIDILVNNAAYQGEAVERFEDITPERTTSIQSADPNPSILDYAATKAAITDFTKGLATHLIERGIRVNGVAPGPVWTPLIPQSFGEEKVSKFGADNPMGRPAQPAELAPVYVFLAGDESRFVNGEIIAATGGRHFS